MFAIHARTHRLLKDLSRRYARRGIAYLRDPAKAAQLADQATLKTQSLEDKPGNPMSQVREQLGLMIRLLRAYALGQYRDIPWRSLLAVVGSILYFVTPIDAVSDFLPGIGFVDDASLLLFVAQQLRADLIKFNRWESGQDTATKPR
jgi:uncharacterized membrane protein YkvA (DUF1232 family)